MMTERLRRRRLLWMVGWLAKSKLTRLTYEPSFEGDAVWSGGRILFTSDRRGQSEIFAMKADGSKPQALFDSEALESLRKACSTW